MHHVHQSVTFGKIKNNYYNWYDRRVTQSGIFLRHAQVSAVCYRRLSMVVAPCKMIITWYCHIPVLVQIRRFTACFCWRYVLQIAVFLVHVIASGASVIWSIKLDMSWDCPVSVIDVPSSINPLRHYNAQASVLIHWGRDKMDAISQTTFSNAFSWMKMHEFRLRFHWSLFLRFELTIFQHWFR